MLGVIIKLHSALRKFVIVEWSCETYKDSSPPTKEDAMISVGSDDRVVKVEGILHAYTHCFLSIVKMAKPTNLL